MNKENPLKSNQVECSIRFLFSAIIKMDIYETYGKLG